jgi:transposase
LDRFTFHTYIEHFLAPTLKAGEIIVMANLSVHKSKRVRELIEGARASLLFLPPYSPDFNPIEETTSKLKGILCKTHANTPQALLEAMGGALDAVSAKDISGMVRSLRTQSAGIASL